MKCEASMEGLRMLLYNAHNGLVADLTARHR